VTELLSGARLLVAFSGHRLARDLLVADANPFPEPDPA
jgi:hypothetical protein